MRRRPAATGATVLLALAVAGCGTTVRLPPSAARTALAPSGLAAGTAAGVGAGGSVEAAGGATTEPSGSGGGGAGGVRGSGSGSGGGGALPSAGASSAGGGAAPAVPAAASGPGVSAGAIAVGISYTRDASALNEAAGVTNAATGDESAYARAVIDDINKHGGIAGRRLAPVWHVYDGTSTQTADEQDQSACADWTEDHHVFAVMGAGSSTLMNCVQKTGAVMVDDNLAVFDASTYQRYPGLVELCCPSLDRIAAEQATALTDQGYFSRWDPTSGRPGALPVKVGILTFDDPNFAQPVTNLLAPRLRRAGYAVEVAHVATPQSSKDLGTMSAGIQSAELKFNTDHVTHVIIFEASGELSLFFLKDAQSQHYFPRYGVNSGNAMQLLIDGGEADPSQLNGALGFSYTPFSDIPEARNPDNGPYSNATRRHCVSVMRSHGITFPSANGEAVALLYCDELYYLRYAVDHAGPVLNAATFIAAVNATGSAFTNAVSFGTFLGPRQHDGAAQIYYSGFDNGCRCMTYRGPRRSIP